MVPREWPSMAAIVGSEYPNALAVVAKECRSVCSVMPLSLARLAIHCHGCPFQCSFCTIINVQGRKSRFRTADDLEAIVRDNCRQGITTFFITDDNMARNKHWEDFFDRLIELKEPSSASPAKIEIPMSMAASAGG